MQTQSHVISVLSQGLVLDVTIGELSITAYVVVSEPDLDRIADIVPPESYEQHENLHAIAIETEHSAHDQITELAFNMMPGDAAVLMCKNDAAYVAALHELGQIHTSTQTN